MERRNSYLWISQRLLLSGALSILVKQYCIDRHQVKKSFTIEKDKITNKMIYMPVQGRIINTIANNVKNICKQRGIFSTINTRIAFQMIICNKFLLQENQVKYKKGVLKTNFKSF